MYVVAHNLMAVNTNRQFGISNRSKNKSMEKLSSGYRINRAADDAAGLSISEKTRNQIRGINQGIENVEDGISLCNVADGALQEISNMMHRMEELSVQAANDVCSDEDRDAIQLEIEEIVDEIDEITEKTQFNERLLFRGRANSSASVTFNDGDQAVTISPSNSAQIAPGDTLYMNISASGMSLYNSTTDTTYDTMSWEDMGLPLSADGVLSADTGFQYQDSVTGLSLSFTANAGFSLYDIMDQLNLNSIPININQADEKGNILSSKEERLDTVMTVSHDEWIARNGIWIQSGANAGEGTYLEIEHISADMLGIAYADVATRDGALELMKGIQSALKQVNGIRSAIGAQTNRLEYTLQSNANYSENLTSAESNIRDTDMAEEICILAKNDILSQAGQAMLAQANQSNQAVLNLLQ